MLKRLSYLQRTKVSPLYNLFPYAPHAVKTKIIAQTNKIGTKFFISKSSLNKSLTPIRFLCCIVYNIIRINYKKVTKNLKNFINLTIIYFDRSFLLFPAILSLSSVKKTTLLYHKYLQHPGQILSCQTMFIFVHGR